MSKYTVKDEAVPTAEYTHESLTTYNGAVTITSGKTGDHRTFFIKTGAQDSWAKGRRYVGLKNGPQYEDNCAFGWVDARGNITLFKKFTGHKTYGAYAKMLMNPEHYKELGCEYRFEITCRRCNRPLTVPSSIDRGLGPVCAEMVG